MKCLTTFLQEVVTFTLQNGSAHSSVEWIWVLLEYAFGHIGPKCAGNCARKLRHRLASLGGKGKRRIATEKGRGKRKKERLAELPNGGSGRNQNCIFQVLKVAKIDLQNGIQNVIWSFFVKLYLLLQYLLFGFFFKRPWFLFTKSNLAALAD